MSTRFMESFMSSRFMKSMLMSTSSIVGDEGYSVPLGEWGGIRVGVHWTFLVVATALSVIVTIQYVSWKYTLLTVIAYFPILLLTTLLHDLGHFFGAMQFGGFYDEFLLWPLGGMVMGAIDNGSVQQEFWVALCGPIAHIPQLLFWVFVMAVSAPGGTSYFFRQFDIEEFNNGNAELFFAELARESFVLNLLLLLLNIFIPAFPLDCAPMFAAVLVEFGFDIVVVAYTVAVIGAFLALTMLIYGFVAIFAVNGPGWFFFLHGVYLVGTSVCLFYIAWRGRAHQHPMFEPQCYRDSYGGNPTGGSTRFTSHVHSRDPYSIADPERSIGSFLSSKRSLGPPRRTPRVIRPGNNYPGSRTGPRGRPGRPGSSRSYSSDEWRSTTPSYDEWRSTSPSEEWRSSSQTNSYSTGDWRTNSYSTGDWRSSSYSSDDWRSSSYSSDSWPSKSGRGRYGRGQRRTQSYSPIRRRPYSPEPRRRNSPGRQQSSPPRPPTRRPTDAMRQPSYSGIELRSISPPQRLSNSRPRPQSNSFRSASSDGRRSNSSGGPRPASPQMRVSAPPQRRPIPPSSNAPKPIRPILRNARRRADSWPSNSSEEWTSGSPEPQYSRSYEDWRSDSSEEWKVVKPKRDASENWQSSSSEEWKVIQPEAHSSENWQTSSSEGMHSNSSDDQVQTPYSPGRRIANRPPAPPQRPPPRRQARQTPPRQRPPPPPLRQARQPPPRQGRPPPPRGSSPSQTRPRQKLRSYSPQQRQRVQRPPSTQPTNQRRSVSPSLARKSNQRETFVTRSVPRGNSANPSPRRNPNPRPGGQTSPRRQQTPNKRRLPQTSKSPRDAPPPTPSGVAPPPFSKVFTKGKGPTANVSTSSGYRKNTRDYLYY